jgi:hypothetical protein
VKQTVLVSNGGFCTAAFFGVFAAFLEAGAGDESAAGLVAFLLPLATGLAVFVTAFLRLAMMGKILGVNKNAIEGMSQPSDKSFCYSEALITPQFCLNYASILP